MARRGHKAGWPLGLIVVLLGAAWVLREGGYPGGGSGAPESQTGYVWIDHRHNDGDSFHVRTPSGSRMEIRLYYVDAPESALKTYANGDTNHARVDDQAEDLGLDRERAVEVGRMAKKWVRGKLRGKEFTVSTYGEKVFNGPRRYAFVELGTGGEKRYLHELLVEEGLVRIHTKGARLPDGTPRSKQERRLRILEREAKKAKKGAWGDAGIPGDSGSPGAGSVVDSRGSR